MANLGPVGPVAAPRQLPPTVGLLSVAGRPDLDGRDPAETRWQLGMEYAPLSCMDGAPYVHCSGAAKTLDVGDTRPAIVPVEPFTVWAGDVCSTFGFTAANYQERALERLGVVRSSVIAAELWDDTLGLGNPHLAAGADVDILTESGPVGLTHGLACLEQALADCLDGARGMIHATPQTLTHWRSLDLVRREGPAWLTAMDTVVVVDAGYSGQDPDGSSATTGNVWAYGTGQVDVRLAEPQVWPATLEEATDRTENVVRFRAEQIAAVSFDECCLVGVRLDVTVCDQGGS